MRRAVGWGARVLRLAGKFSELLAWLFILLLIARDGGGGGAEGIPEFWTETRRGRMKAVRAWLRSSVIAGTLLAPVGFAIEPGAREPSFINVLLMMGASATVCVLASLLVMFALISLVRFLRTPRPLSEMAVLALTVGLVCKLLLDLSQQSASSWLYAWPFIVGAIWGWLYWFFAYRPRPPYTR